MDVGRKVLRCLSASDDMDMTIGEPDLVALVFMLDREGFEPAAISNRGGAIA
jgi:hypothetical protein